MAFKCLKYIACGEANETPRHIIAKSSVQEERKSTQATNGLLVGSVINDIEDKTGIRVRCARAL